MGNAWLTPSTHCSALRRLLVLPGAFRPEAKERELESACVSDLVEFVKGFWSTVGCEILASGNTACGETQAWVEGHISNLLQHTPQPLVQHDVLRVEPGTATVWLEHALDATQPNSALEIYWQLPGRDGMDWDESRTRIKVLLDMLEDMMYEPIFDQLRTKEQLGYSVGCSTRDTHGVLGFTIYICSAVQRPPILLERVEAFLEDFGRRLRNFESNKFFSHASSLAGRWLEPLRTLSDVQSTCWSEIVFGSPVFDRHEREAAVLGTTSLEDLISLYDLHIAPGARGRACIVTSVAPHADGSIAKEAASLSSMYKGCRDSRVNVVQNESQFHSQARLCAPRSGCTMSGTAVG